MGAATPTRSSMRQLHRLAVVLFVCLLGTPSQSQQAVTPLVNGYVVDLPATFELADDSERAQLPAQLRAKEAAAEQESLPGEIVLYARAPRPLVGFFLVSTNDALDERYRGLSRAAPDSWARLTENVVHSMRNLFGASLAMTPIGEPTFSRNDIGDIIMTTEYEIRLDDLHLLIGHRVYFRNVGSFEVAFGYAPGDPTEPVIRQAVSTIRLVFPQSPL